MLQAYPAINIVKLRGSEDEWSDLRWHEQAENGEESPQPTNFPVTVLAPSSDPVPSLSLHNALEPLDARFGQAPSCRPRSLLRLSQTETILHRLFDGHVMRQNVRRPGSEIRICLQEVSDGQLCYWDQCTLIEPEHGGTTVNSPTLLMCLLDNMTWNSALLPRERMQEILDQIIRDGYHPNVVNHTPCRKRAHLSERTILHHLVDALRCEEIDAAWVLALLQFILHEATVIGRDTLRWLVQHRNTHGHAALDALVQPGFSRRKLWPLVEAMRTLQATGYANPDEPSRHGTWPPLMYLLADAQIEWLLSYLLNLSEEQLQGLRLFADAAPWATQVIRDGCHWTPKRLCAKLVLTMEAWRRAQFSHQVSRPSRVPRSGACFCVTTLTSVPVSFDLGWRCGGLKRPCPHLTTHTRFQTAVTSSIHGWIAAQLSNVPEELGSLYMLTEYRRAVASVSPYRQRPCAYGMDLNLFQRLHEMLANPSLPLDFAEQFPSPNPLLPNSLLTAVLSTTCSAIWQKLNCHQNRVLQLAQAALPAVLPREPNLEQFFLFRSPSEEHVAFKLQALVLSAKVHAGHSSFRLSELLSIPCPVFGTQVAGSPLPFIKFCARLGIDRDERGKSLAGHLFDGARGPITGQWLRHWLREESDLSLTTDWLAPSSAGSDDLLSLARSALQEPKFWRHSWRDYSASLCIVEEALPEWRQCRLPLLHAAIEECFRDGPGIEQALVGIVLDYLNARAQ